MSGRRIGWWPKYILAREKWSVETERGGERERWFEVGFYSSILILTKIRKYK